MNNIRIYFLKLGRFALASLLCLSIAGLSACMPPRQSNVNYPSKNYEHNTPSPKETHTPPHTEQKSHQPQPQPQKQQTAQPKQQPKQAQQSQKQSASQQSHQQPQQHDQKQPAQKPNQNPTGTKAPQKDDEYQHNLPVNNSNQAQHR